MKFNRSHTADNISPDCFDEAIEKAITRSHNMRVAYEKSTLSHKVATLVRQLREQRKMTQGDLAKEIGIPQSFVSRIENPNASKEPSLGTIAKVMNGLGYRLTLDIERVDSRSR